MRRDAKRFLRYKRGLLFHICILGFLRTPNEGVANSVHVFFLGTPNRTDWVVNLFVWQHVVIVESIYQKVGEFALTVERKEVSWIWVLVGNLLSLFLPFFLSLANV